MRFAPLAIVVAATVLPLQAFGQGKSAQTTMIGPLAEVNMTTFGGDDIQGLENRTAMGLGVQIQRSMGDVAFVRSGLHYAMRGTKVKESVATGTVKLNYVELPVLLGYQFPTGGGLRPYLLAGGHVGVKVGCEAEGEVYGISGSASCKDAFASDMSSTDLALVGGGGLSFAAGANTVAVDFRYAYGLQKLSDDGNAKNRGYSVAVAYMFPLGGK